MTYNSKRKIYRDKSYRESICNKSVYKDKKEKSSKVYNRGNRPAKYNTGNVSDKRNIKRTYERIIDIALSNEFLYFITLTLDISKINIWDKEAISKEIGKFNDLIRKNNGIYLCVPERGGLTNRIHFHYLVSSIDFIVPKPTPELYCKEINTKSWRCGEICIEPIYDIDSLIVYILKSIKYGCEKIFGKYYFAGGKDLRRNPEIVLSNKDYDSEDLREYTPNPNVDISYKYKMGFVS